MYFMLIKLLFSIKCTVMIKWSKQKGEMDIYQGEPGVLPQSERYFATPSSMARELFLFLTRCGHFYCGENYRFHYDSQIGREESHRQSYQIQYVCQGALTVELGGKRQTAGPGFLTLMDCRQPHYYQAAEGTEFLWMHFDGAYVRPFYLHILSGCNGRHILPDYGGVGAVMRQIVGSFKEKARPTEAEYSRLLYGVLCSLAAPSEAAERPEDSTALNQARAYMDDHLFTDLTVEDAARAAHLSASHFSRLFKARLGCSPHEYIVLRRIDRAKELLSSTAASVKEIAFACGYHSEGNFIHSFRLKTGISPAVFRQSLIGSQKEFEKKP